MASMEIRTLTVTAGRGKQGQREPLAGLDLEMGKVLSIVGPTGSGKTARWRIMTARAARRAASPGGAGYGINFLPRDCLSRHIC